MKRTMRIWGRALLLGIVGLLPCAAHAARDPRPDQSLFDPATDTGRYMSVHDAETLLKGRWAVGFYLDYGRRPLQLRNAVTNVRFDIVRDELSGTAVGSYGITDWFTIGASVPVTFWQVFFDPNTQLLTGGAAAKQQKAGLGDIRIETKFRLLDIERYNFGIAVVPHFVFASGRRGTFISGERWTPGVTLALEANPNERLWLGANFGYQFVSGQNQYFAGNASAVIDDLLRFGIGARVKITDEWALLGEGLAETVAKSAFKVSTQTPLEVLGGVQWTPQRAPSARGLAITLMGGGGITRGVGAPQARAILGVSYPTPKIVKIKEVVNVQVEEKIVISQKIHFAFNSSEIRPVSFPILDDVAELMRRHAGIRQVRVEGHTDGIGGDAYNQRLSEQRSRAVVAYLIKKGIEGSRLVPVGYGKSRPIADNNTVEGRAKNRRTEFTVNGD